ncbi:hypothetical protein [Candidatus Nephthysia bennettiae]|uniref:Uncharacterized protein n=1 Tax=Candidatus Nephthysia bennettiae TaxID=3127016 RepID=A0A934JVR0_9BACT|nr:hypothetical protein [Candidatus Dormibacteraeota bacterium]
MFERTTEELAARERPHVIAEELRLLLRRRDQISLQASRLAGELARAGFGEAMGSISTVDWIPTSASSATSRLQISSAWPRDELPGGQRGRRPGGRDRLPAPGPDRPHRACVERVGSLAARD